MKMGYKLTENVLVALDNLREDKMNIHLFINKNTGKLEVIENCNKGELYCSIPNDKGSFDSIYVGYGWSSKYSDQIPIWVMNEAEKRGIRMSQVQVEPYVKKAEKSSRPIRVTFCIFQAEGCRE
jgi:hypothetical protein